MIGKIWTTIKENFQPIFASPPGRRFQDYYHRKQKHNPPCKFIAKILGGLLCLVIALILSVLPGPAFIFWFAGLALISSQFLAVAKMLDRSEMLIRRWIEKYKSKKV